MNIISDAIAYLQANLYVIQLLFIIVCFVVVFYIILKVVQRHLMKKVKTRKQASNVKVFLSLVKFLFAFFLLIAVIAFFYGDLGDLSFVAGLLTVAIGWALQKPISGVVAWLILLTRRPFDIGDRVLLSGIKGDITNITLTHIFLDEVGGTIEGEERSGRTAMIPTSLIFEKEIINYTHQDDFILVEIIVNITYESNLHKAEELIIDAVKKIMQQYWEGFPPTVSKEPHNRLQFRDSGIEISVRYYTITMKRNEIATNIRREIFKQIRGAPDVEFAYPHTEVLVHHKNP